MKRQIQNSAFVLLLPLCLHGTPLQAQAEAAGQGQAIYSQNFQKVSLIHGIGAVPSGVYDNTYAGGATPLRVVQSGDKRLGNVLEVQAHGFCQVVLGEMALKQNAVYRVSLDIAARGTQQVSLTLRLVPFPYNGYISSQEQVNETVRRVTFLGRAPADAQPVGLFLNADAFTTFTVDNIQVEEVVGAVPPQEPPTAGNLIPNAGFEIGGDGWFTRGPIEFLTAADAYEGRRVAVMHGISGQDILSSTFLRLSFASDYLAQVRLRAVSGAPHIHMSIAGQNADITLDQADSWKTLTLRFHPQPPSGKFTPARDDALYLECSGAGTAAQLDAVSVQAAGAAQTDIPYQPKAPLEIGLAIDAPEGALTVGESATATALSSKPLTAATLQIRDEDERIVRTLPLAFHGSQAQVKITGLPPGFWHLVTVTSAGAHNEGETFLSVIPAQPTLPAGQWMYGTHIIDDPAMREACWKLGLHWDRLHDTGNSLKWPNIQPDGPNQWLWHDEEIARRRAPGEALMGNLDLLPGWVPKQPKTRDAPPVPPGTVTGLDFITDSDYPLWENFCRQTAAHYAGRIDTFEVTNEINYSVPPPQYLRILQAAAHGLRAGNPRVTIVAPAVGGSIDDGWLREMIRLGAGKYCDVISYHGYGLDTNAAAGGPDALQRGVKDLRAALATAGTPGLPIWDSEAGFSGIQSRFTKFSLPHWSVGGREAGRMLAESAACAKAGGLGRIFYYAAFQATVTAEEDPNVFNFGDVNRVLKMPLEPLGTAISFLEGRRFVREDLADQKAGIEHLVFTGRGAAVHMLWKLAGTSSVPVPLSARVVNMWGRKIATPHGQALLGQDPLYFVLPGR